MKKKDIELFQKAIHNLKDIIGKANILFKEVQETLDELYELFEDLYSNGEDNKK